MDEQGNPVSINSVMFSVVDGPSLDGTGFGWNGYEVVGGSTGWLTLTIPVQAGEPVFFQLSVEDVFDGVYDSAVLLDNFSWSTQDPDEPTLIEDFQVHYLSPKRGSETGGDISRILGERFNDSCQAWLDDTEVSVVFESSQSLRFVTPAHAPGTVDVLVTCDGMEPQGLVNGFTFYTEEATDTVSPEILTVEPHYVTIEGGQTVRVIGQGFANGTTASIDDVPLATTVISSTELDIVVPPHAEGPVDIEITTYEGLTDTYPGGLLYITVPEGVIPGEETEERADFAQNPSGCTHTALGLGWGWLALAGLRRRRA